MAAKYDFKTSPDIQGEKEQPTLYPQIVVSGTKNLKDLAKDIARRSQIPRSLGQVQLSLFSEVTA